MSAADDAREASRLYQLLQPYFASYASLLDMGRGTAFPTTGIDGGALLAHTRFFRTDLGFACYYDGTRWLTVDDYPATFGFFDATTITYAATTAGTRLALFRSDYKPFFTVGYDVPGIGATNTGANFWTFNFVTSTGTTIWSFNTAADAAGSNPSKGNSTWTQPAAPITFVQLNLVATGAPSGIIPRFPTLYYRLVVG